MKYLTITVPCYNSEQYLARCLDSLVTGGEHVEILVVDDGSTDRTGEIAEDYAKCYPGIVTAIHKENGGHGSGVNLGLSLATGRYLKVVDSDDWLDEAAYQKLLARLSDWCESGAVMPDLVICDYTYNHLDEGIKKEMCYDNVFPKERLCTWKEMAISSIHLLLRGDLEAKEEHHRIWAELKENNPKLYYRLRYTTISGLTNLPGRLGKKVTVDGYRIAKKIYKFQ